jgi:inner membrane protein
VVAPGDDLQPRAAPPDAPALAFGGLLGVLYGALYALLQLEDVALLSGSLLLFAMLSLAMWFTRNLHRTQPA